MTLPTSGPLSINAIRTELATTTGSLRALSSQAGFSTPDAMSDFYGYNNNVTITVYGKTSLTYTSNLTNYRFYYSVNGVIADYLSNSLNSGAGAWGTTCASRFTFQFPKGATLAFGTYFFTDTSLHFSFGATSGSTCPTASTTYCDSPWTYGTVTGNTNIAINVALVGGTAATRNIVSCA